MPKIKRSLAIIVGINQYEHIPTLKNAVADAVGLASVLKDTYGYEVLLLLNQRATKAKLALLIKSLQRRIIALDNKLVQISKSDRILFYFAGHGFAEEAIDSEAGKPAGYFMPQDASDNNKSSWLSMHEVYEAFSALNCHHLLMILDCCFAGRISWIGQGRNVAPAGKLYRQSYDRFIKHQTEQIITSAAYDEEAQDLSRFGRRGEKKGNSPFAYLLLKVLKGNFNGSKDKFIEAIVEDGVITVQEVFAYLQNKLGEIAAGQTPGLSQPRKYNSETGEYVHLKGEYIFPLPKFNPEHLPKYKLNKNINPYKGLASFNTEDSELFFGRTVLSQQLAEVVKQQPLTIVLGASGSGKSSLAKAGLISVLKAESSEQRWQIFEPMRPGGSPFKELNKILTQSTSGSSIVNLPLPEQIQLLCQRFNYRAKRNSQSKLLLVIDQAEELLTLSRNQQEGKDFIAFLIRLLSRYSQLRIVLTLRSDFESQVKDVVQETRWQKAWQQGKFIVTPMNREELQQAIEEPAAQRTLFFESPQLVDRLIDEAINRTGILPLLSFTLSELYLRYLEAEENGVRSDRTIAEKDYQELGGVQGSLAQAATRTYRKLREQKIDSSTIINNVMLRMVALNGNEITRRRVLKSELNYPEPIQQDVKSIIDRFVEARLFTTGKDAEGQEYVEPVHDALVTRWQKLISKPETQEILLLQRRLTPAAEEWYSHNREQKLDFRPNQVKHIEGRLTSAVREWYSRNREQKLDSRFNQVKHIISGSILALKRSLKQSKTSRENPKQYLWNASPYLDILDRVLRSDDGNWLNQIETVFVRRSVGRKKLNTRLRRFVAISIIILSGVLTGWALKENRKALLGTINTYKESAEANLRSGSDLEATIDILRARQELNSFLINWFQPEAEVAAVKGTVHNVLYQIKERNRLQTNLGSSYYMALSPDNKLLAFSYEDTLTLWNLEEDRQVDAISTEQNFIYTLAFNPDSDQIATGGSDGKVKLWDIDEVGNITPPKSHHKIDTGNSKTEDKNVYSVVFLQENILATIGEGDSVRVWDTQSGEMKEKELPTGQKSIINLAFSTKKNLLAIAGGDEKVRLCKISLAESAKEVNLCPDGLIEINPQTDNNEDEIQTIAFNKDNKLAVGTEKGEIILGKVKEDGKDLTFEEDDKVVTLEKDPPENTTDINVVNSIAFFNDGRLATIGADDIVRVRKSSGEEIKPIQQFESSIRNKSVAFSSDGELLATGGDDGTVKLWNADSGKPEKRILTEQGSINSVVFGPNDKQLITAGTKNGEEVKFWNLDRTYFPPGDDNDSISTDQDIVSVIFDPQNPELLGTIDVDGTFKWWDVKQKSIIKQIETKLQNVKSAVLTPDGENLITLSENGKVQRWIDTENSEDLLSNYEITNFALSPDGQKMAIGDRNGIVWEWDGKSENPEFLLETQQGSIDALSYTPDGKLATVGEDNTVSLWATSAKAPAELTLEKEVNSIVFTNNNLLIVGKDGIVQLWNLDNISKIKEITVQKDVEYKVTFSAEKELLAFAGSNGIVRLLDRLGNQIDEKQTNQSFIESVKFSSDGKRLVTIGKNNQQENTVEIWNIKEKNDKFILQKQDDNFEGKTDLKNLFSDDGEKLTSTAFNSENELLVAFGNDRQAEVYNISQVSLESFPVQQSKISSLALSQDGELLATAGADGSLRLGDTSGTILDQTLTLQGEIKSIVFSADNKLLATVGEKTEGRTTVKVWHIVENKWLHPFKQLPEKKGIYKVAFSSNGKLLGTSEENGDKDNLVSFWQIGDEEDLFKEICSLIGDYLLNGSDIVEDRDRALCGGELTLEQTIVQDSHTGKFSETEEQQKVLSALAGDFYDRGQEKVSEDIVNKTPLNVDDYINKGVAYFRLRNKDSEKNYIQEAIYHYTQALEMKPTDSQAVQALVNRGIAYSTGSNSRNREQAILDDQELAIADYSEVINHIDDRYVDAYIGRGISYSALPEPKHDRAIMDYKQAIAISNEIDNINSSANAHYALGFTLSLQEGKKLEAIEAYKKAKDYYEQIKGKQSYAKSASERIEQLQEN